MKNTVIKKVDGLIPLRPLVFDEIPQFDAQDYLRRIDALIEAGESAGATHIVVYGDREHFSNIEFLTGLDPRFEEALVVVSRGKKPILITGNECVVYAGIIPYDIQVELYSTFSLSGQPRQKADLGDIFKIAGLTTGSKVGLVGWKVFDEKDFDDFRHVYEIPHFIVERLNEVVGAANLFNANYLMIDNAEGLRHQLDTKELILSEIAGTKASRNTLRVLQNLKVGISELEASEFLNIDGQPMAVHPNVNFGERNVCLGVASPTQHKKLEMGENVSVGMSFRRSLIHKVGVYARNSDDLSPEFAAAVDKEFHTYFSAIIAWYEAVGIGVAGGEVYDAVERAIGDFDELGIGLNPGHLSHTDEWTNSMFSKGSMAKIRSGLILQCDIIAVLPKTKIFLHAEDGLVIADQKTREEIRAMAPAAWERITARREFMKNVLNINISDDIIPTSDLQGVFFPYMADLHTIFAKS